MSIKDDILAVGPKEVRTPNMTVISHDIEKIQRVLDRRAVTALPTFCSFARCRTIPKKSAYQPFADEVQNLPGNFYPQ